jgi:hypothetical protein
MARGAGRSGLEEFRWWAAVDSNHVPPRCSALSGLLLRVASSTKLPVLSGVALHARPESTEQAD